MPDHGYCTVADVRRVLQEADLTAALAANSNEIVVDAITGLTETLIKATLKHWYVPGGITEDTHGIVATTALTRDDEHDIPTHAGFVHGASERDEHLPLNTDSLLEAGPRHERRRRERREPKREIKIAFGEDWPRRDETIPAYTRIRLDRKDVSAVNELSVVNADGGFDDWVANSSFSGGVGNAHRGEDYWVRVNNDGFTELYLDVHAMDDDIASLSKAVYVDIDYGEADLPTGVRRGVALLAASELITDDEFLRSIPDQGQLMNIETKASAWERRGLRKLSHHWLGDPPEAG